ncbi:hypothetical protein F7725_026829, partial [Dissostichus mawsoni]
MEFRMGYRSQDLILCFHGPPWGYAMEPRGGERVVSRREVSESSDEEPSKEPLQQTNFDLNDADKFIVCQSQLMSLFTICPACCGKTQDNVCATCGYERFWQNQPMLHRNMPACNLLLSGAIHFSGCMATQTIRMLKLFGLQCISASTFFRHQRLYTIPTIVQARENEQARIIRELKKMGGGLILSGLGKALDAAAKERECEDLKLWRPAIIYHLYWTASSTPDGDPDVMEAKWQSMVNHVQDIHEHGTPAFPCCAHPPLEGEARDKEWLEPVYFGSRALHKYITQANKRMFGSCLHSIRPIPWRHFTPSSSTLHQSTLALHFNHNSSREVARTSDGEVRYAVRYPRFCKGGWVVRPIKEKPSY